MIVRETRFCQDSCAIAGTERGAEGIGLSLFFFYFFL